MRGDGDGWVECGLGHRHWGRHGAAGLLLRHVGDDVRVLLQHRALWSAEGGTWGVPGGARDSDESAVAAATRECAEETGVPPEVVRPRGQWVVDHGGWSYTTVVADLAVQPPLQQQEESIALGWVAEPDLTDLPLHPGFAAAWPELRAPVATVLVDVANVMGSRPDGWWHDRGGAATRLLDELGALPRTVRNVAGSWWSVTAVVAVLEGQARVATAGSGSASGAPPSPNPSLPSPPSSNGVTTVAAEGSGDDELVAQVTTRTARGEHCLLVTADRELRERAVAAAQAPGADGRTAGTVTVVGPRQLLDALHAAG